jgi:glycosyltransferase involved in cell wall biosynthesis
MFLSMIATFRRTPFVDRLRSTVEPAVARCWLLLLGFFAPSRLLFLLRRSDYAAWRDVNALGAGARDDLNAVLTQKAGALPRISVVMPVYRPEIAHLKAAIESVEHQLYGGWELCLCDDGSGDPTLLDLLAQLESGSDRVKIASHAANRGIAAALNSAAALATGDVLIFLDQDDVLAADCLGEFALTFALAPDVDLAYSDSDKIDANGQRCAPSFKPGWSPWLLLSHMYLSHAVALRRDLFTALGGFASGFDGSQDYELILRATERARTIRHIPRILYHWRAGAGSTALAASEKQGSVEAGQAAVADAFTRRGIAASACRPDWSEQAGIGLFQPRFAKPAATLSLVILAGDGRCLVETVRTALDAGFPDDGQIIVVGDGRALPSPQINDGWLARASWIFPTGHLAQDVRAALQRATGDVTLVMHGHARPVGEDWLAQMCGYALSQMALVGARVVGPDNRIIAAGLVNAHQPAKPELAFAGWARGRHGPSYMARTAREVLAVTGECLAFDRQVRLWLARAAGQADDLTALGQLFSEQTRAEGGSILICGDIEIDIAAPSPSRPQPISHDDPWYNPNLGAGRQQFRPTVRSAAVRQANPVRIAVVTHNLDHEGAQSTLLDLVEGLVSQKYVRPMIISARAGALGDRLDQMGIPFHIVARPGRKASRTDVVEYRAVLSGLYRDNGAQVVLANTLETYCAVAAATDAGLAALWWQHEGGPWWRYYSALPLWRQALAFSGFGSAYRVIQVAEVTRRCWQPIATRDNFEVVRHGIPAYRLVADRRRWSRDAARETLGVADAKLCVVLLGSVSRRKSQGDVIRALAHFPDNFLSGLRVLIVGDLVDVGYHAELQQLLAGLSPLQRAAIEMTGRVPDAALYLAAADVFLCCSRQESAPRAILEAMAFGLPILTTPVDGIPELVSEGVQGQFFVPGDVRQLSRMLQALLHDRPRSMDMGARALVRAAQINDFDGMVARFGQLLREAAWQRRSVIVGGELDG